MVDAFVGGLLVILQWKAFSFMLIGIAVGFWVGLLPGLGVFLNESARTKGREELVSRRFV